MVLRIVFFGTPLFAASTLEFLLQKPVDVVAIVTKPDKPQGRSQVMLPPQVKMTAERLRSDIPLFQPLKASNPEFAAVLQNFKADLFVVVAYSEIIKENLLQMPRLGCVNVHASLLPKYRGAAPIQRCLINGEKESGITIIKMVKELDAGDMLAVRKTPVADDMNSGQLSEKLCQLGKEALWEVVQNYERGVVTATPQDHAMATYASKIISDECKINWTKKAVDIHNLIRGATPKPGAWCFVSLKGVQKRLLIKKAAVADIAGAIGIEGELLDKPGFVIACGEGALSILEMQLEGKKSMSREEFERGISKRDIQFLKN